MLKSPILTGILAFFVLSSLSLPAFAEVTFFDVDKEQVTKRDTVELSGMVENEDTGMVTIVIRDPEDSFVMLKQARIASDNTFLTEIVINPKFTLDGIYNATAFVLNMTAGHQQSFEYFSKGIPTSTTEQTLKIIEDMPESIVDDISDQNLIENISEIVEITIDDGTKLASFVDPEKDPQHYVDRYNNEIIYKNWFDSNFSQYDSIYDAVGLEKPITIIQTTEQKVIPTAEASLSTPSTTPEDNSEVVQVMLAVSALGILFGAVYGIKRKVDDNAEQIETNSEQIQHNSLHIKEKLLGVIPHNDPKDLLKTRLAKGEITIVEYRKLLKLLDQ